MHFSGFLVCFCAIAVQLSLPLLHYLHLASEHAITPLAEYLDCRHADHGQGVPAPVLSRSDEKTGHHHDPLHCRICRTIYLFSSFAVPAHDAEAYVPPKPPEVFSDSYDSEFHNRRFSDCTARAPPGLT